jgi:mRNA (guanine-N7-)-methyltransferase
MKRDRPEVLSSENAKVADHYSSRPNQGVQARTESAILHLRGFNNWVKSVLISLHLRGPGASVLDLAGGKGGDFSKWKNAAIGHLVLADVAHVSVEHARERYLTSHDNLSRLFPALFIAADCFGAPLFDKVDPELRFDLVSCQFAFHYAFESEERLRMALRNISERLRPGGCFIGTVPNTYRLVQLLRSARGLSWSNSIVSIEFDAATDKDCLPEFGARYTFALVDAVDRVPEFLVHFAVLQRVADEYGLDLVMREEFSSFYQKYGSIFLFLCSFFSFTIRE